MNKYEVDAEGETQLVNADLQVALDAARQYLEDGCREVVIRPATS